MGIRFADSQAKELLLGWPQVTAIWSHGKRPHWIRAQPRVKKASARHHPRLVFPGTTAFRSQPDGLWVHFVVESTEQRPLAVDCIAVEVCNSRQNLADKRSRYGPKIQAATLEVDEAWPKDEISWKRGTKKARNFFIQGNWPEGRTYIPVRHVRVLYFLPTDGGDVNFKKIAREIPLEAHEFLIPQNRLRNFADPQLQTFLKQTAPCMNVFPFQESRGVATSPFVESH
jgi:hypothetical protein